MEKFKYNDEYDNYVIKMDGVLVCCQEPDMESVEKADIIVKKYYQEIDKIMDFVRDNICDMFENSKMDDLQKLLGEPVIDLDAGTISYYEQKLDNFHIIQVEFGGVIDKLYRVSVDG